MLIMCTFLGGARQPAPEVACFKFFFVVFSLCARLRLKDEDEPRVEEEDVVTSHF